MSHIIKTYRKAYVIEMHDSMSSINIKEHNRYFMGAIGQREWGKTIYIHSSSLRDLAGMFNLDFNKGEYRRNHRDDKEIFHEFEDVTLILPYDDGNPEEVDTLECHIISDRMVNVRVTANYENDEKYTKEFTYCGSFTIWWADEVG